MPRTSVVMLALVASACVPSKPAHGGSGGDSAFTVQLDASTYASYCRSREAIRIRKELVDCSRATDAYAFAQLAKAPARCAGLEAFVTVGRVVYSSGAGAACLAALNAAPCNGLEQAELAESRCREVLTGTIAPSGVCAIEEDCASGSCRYPEPCSGTCVADIPEGASCANDSKACGPGLLCDSGKSFTCVRQVPGTLGQPCDRAEPQCQVGLFCDAGTCRTVHELFAPCSAPEQCGPGQTCTSSIGFCDDWLRSGERCAYEGHDDVPYRVCAPGRYCGSSGTCVAQVGNGEPCSSSKQCLDGWCDPSSGSCAAQLAIGEACVESAQCDGRVASCWQIEASQPSVCAPHEPVCSP